MGEDLCKSYSQQEVNIQNIKNSYNLKPKKGTIKTISNGAGVYIFWRRHTDGQQAYENILCHFILFFF